MQIFLLILFGLISGTISGMGMGGGTALIPLLTLLLSINQKTAQGINLLTFLPTGIIAIISHIKNKLIKKKGLGFIILPAVMFSAGASFLTSLIPKKILGVSLGVFLIVIAVIEFIVFIREIIGKK
ncbi:MAG: TSUP family transporter [Clostridia bacterium]